jgi:serine acetyltransferase
LFLAPQEPFHAASLFRFAPFFHFGQLPIHLDELSNCSHLLYDFVICSNVMIGRGFFTATLEFKNYSG